MLARVGLGLAAPDDAKSGKRATLEELTSYLDAHIDRLADEEHKGWMAQRARNGWRYGTPRNDTLKLHPLMVPYRDLPDVEKDKDREALRRYPAQAKAAGFEIVWL